MNRLLLRRLPRDLKEGLGRYAALIFMIALGIYLVSSIVGASETVLHGAVVKQSEFSTQDGFFTTFLPLSAEDLEKLEADGCEVSEEFYTDLEADGTDDKLRMFRVREKIDKILLDEGRLPEATGECVLEKRYAACNDLVVGDHFKAGGSEFEIVGIGCVPDYDQPKANFSDTAVNSKSFGLLFVTGEGYQSVRDNGAFAAEEYVYAFRLAEGVFAGDFRERVKDLPFDYKEVEDPYFREMMDRLMEDRYDLEDGLAELADGGKELYDGTEELCDGTEELSDGGKDLSSGLSELTDANETIVAAADAVAEDAFARVNEKLESLPLPEPVTVTEENYEEKLDSLAETLTQMANLQAVMTGSAPDLSGAEALKEAKKGLEDVLSFRDGVREYIEGVSKASSGAAELADGSDELKDGAKELKDGAKELKDGIEELNDGLTELLDRVFDPDLHNMTAFVEAKDNERIEAGAGDVLMDRNAGLVAGIIVLALFGYVISVFVVHRIEQEASVIGTLYALGVKKHQLLLHYIALPTLMAFLGGVIGVAVGLTPFGIKMQLADTYNYFSLPNYDLYMPAYLWAYGIILPPAISGLVNALVINGKLSRPALSLIRNEQTDGAVRRFSIKTKSFPMAFAIRQLVRESRSALTIVLGMLVSLLVVMLGADCYVMCMAVKNSTVEDTKYEAMYLYKYPEEEAPAGGEAAYVETLRTDCLGYTLDVMLIGLEDGESEFFDVHCEKGMSKAVINNSLKERYGYKTGEKFTLFDPVEERNYSFTVTGVTRYSNGFTIFMDKESMCELFDREEDYYNAVISDHELPIDSGRLYSTTRKKDIETSAGVYVEQMMSLILTLVSAGSVIFAIVMYLMMGVMIDRSSFGISLIRIFGYRPKEVRRLYLTGNFVLVAVGAIFCIPIAKTIIDHIFPFFIPNVACTMQMAFPLWLYAVIYFGVLLIMLLAMLLLTAKVNRITPAEVLKNRE